MSRSVFVVLPLVALCLAASAQARAADCNDNGIPDSTDIASGTSLDCNTNGIPDECELGPVFSEMVVTADGAGPLVVVGADLDGDGDVDVVAGHENDEVTWYENLDGEGGFGDGQTITTGVSLPSSIAVADLDGDEDLDVVVAYLNLLSWYANDGTGSFGSEQIVATGGTFDLTLSVDVGDLDHDGDPDLLLGSDTTQDPGPGGLEPIVWFANSDGAGTFSSAQVLFAGSNRAPSVTVADIDGNGADDDILAGLGTMVVWFEGDPFVGFGPAQRVNSGSFVRARSVFAADLDRDGDNDVLAALGDLGPPKIVWYENSGGGTFDPEQVLTATGRVPTYVSATDVGGDGNLDVVAADFGQGGEPDWIFWLENADGEGSFSTEQLVTSVGPGTLSENPENIATADVNGDGAVDILASLHGSDTIAWYRQEHRNCNGNDVPDDCEIASGASHDCNANGVPDECEAAPVFSEVHVSSDGTLPIVVTGADLDADGDIDVVAGYCIGTYPCPQFGELRWYENLDGNGQFGAGQPVTTGIDTPHSFDTGDLDGDDDLDIALVLQAGFAWYENDGTGSFGPEQWVDLAVGFELGSSIRIVDLDDDGDLDLLAGAHLGFGAGSRGKDGLHSLAWYENTDGEGTFSSPLPLATNDTPYHLTSADFDGDGDPDVLAGNIYNYAWFENTDGQGGFGPEQPLGDGDRPAVVAADLDRDGDNDVLAAERHPGWIVWHENTDGLGSFGPERVLADEGRVVSHVLATDLDGDHDIDVVAGDHDWGGPDPDRILWLENADGAGAFSTSRALVVTDALSTLPDSIAAADVDGDGAQDLIACHFGTDTILWYRQRGGDCNHNDVPDDCDIDSGASDDCNANGIPDECEQDCDANGVPDVCETSCPSCDTDGDGCPDEVDSDPFDPLVCGDGDTDGCDDCSNGGYDPWTDGTNSDADGVCDAGDCAPSNGQVWAEPQPVTTLRLEGWPLTEFVWQLPPEPGSLVPRYDLLRTEEASAFATAAECVVWDLAASTVYGSSETPEAGGIHYYVVRLENDCPGPGAMGSDSTGQPRTAPDCP